MTTESSTKVIKIVVKDESSKPIERVAKQFKKLNREVKKTSNNMRIMTGFVSRLKGVFAGMIAAMGVREVIRSADAFQLLKDRIRALWGEGVDAESVFQQIAKVARETNAPLETLADGFARISLSAKGMGLTVSETARGVKSLQQTLRLSGASTAEVNSVYLQFSQAMGLSRLQGQELRAVMLGNAKLAQLLADEFNTTRGALRDLGEKGLLDTARIFQMLIDKGGELDKQAGKLKVTFGQAMIKALDAFRIIIDKVNTAFSGSQGFNTMVQFALKHMNLFAGLLTTLVTGGLLIGLAVGIKAIGVAFATHWGPMILMLSGPAGIAAAFIAVAAAIAGVQVQLALLEKPAQQSLKHLQKLQPAQEAFFKARERRIKAEEGYKEYKDSFFANPQELLRRVKAAEKVEAATKKIYDKERKQFHERRKLRDDSEGKPAKAEGPFAKMNKLYRERNIITREQLDLLRKIQRTELEAKFAKNTISSVAYSQQLEKINKNYEDMLKKMEAIENKDNIFYGIQQGAEATLKSIGTLAEEISKATTQAFKHLEDNLVEFTKTGRFEFAKFAQAIMDDITRMVIRMSIIKPLAGALVGGISGSAGSAGSSVTTTSTGSQFSNYSANGNAFIGGNVIPFASGGIVNRTTPFGMSGGRTGVMGESGPEAILPLSRGSNGKLGVQGSGTVVNVINNSNAETETKESTNNDGSKQIDVYIVNKMSEAIGEGRFDKSFSQLYGMQRRGN